MAESIYEGVVTLSYKKTTRAEANRTGLSSNNRGESTSSNTHPEKYESAGKRRKRYVDCSKSAPKHCMIRGLGNSSDEYKVLGEFGTKYPADQLMRNHGSNPKPKFCFQKKQENHTIIENMVDELHIVESKKVRAVNHEAPEFLENDYDENNLYQVENMILGETKEKIE